MYLWRNIVHHSIFAVIWVRILNFSRVFLSLYSLKSHFHLLCEGVTFELLDIGHEFFGSRLVQKDSSSWPVGLYIAYRFRENSYTSISTLPSIALPHFCMGWIHTSATNRYILFLMIFFLPSHTVWKTLGLQKCYRKRSAAIKLIVGVEWNNFYERRNNSSLLVLLYLIRSCTLLTFEGVWWSSDFLHSTDRIQLFIWSGQFTWTSHPYQW